MILVSACLVGIDCRYHGESEINEKILRLVKEKKAILVCPEQLGGMATPRVPCEIIDGDGEAVLNNNAKVMNKIGEDKSLCFVKGAQEALKIAKMYNVKTAILKKRSPSCGSGIIYDGSFTGKKKSGDGVTCAVLKKEGIRVLDEENFEDYLK